jgi:hypothetical protein
LEQGGTEQGTDTRRRRARYDPEIEGGADAGLRDQESVGVDPRALWRVALRDDNDRYVLERAFERDPELRLDVGFALIALVELGVQEQFVRAFVSQLREAGPQAPPALAVLPAAAVALEDVQCRP